MTSDKFTNPFRYVPSPQVRIAAESLTASIDERENLKNLFSEGKMLGVLVISGDGVPEDPLVRRTFSPDGEPICFLAGFSGLAGGSNMIEGFVPPVFDLLNPSGHYRQEESRISAMNAEIAGIEGGRQMRDATERAASLKVLMDREIADMKASLKEAKERRDMARAAGTADEESLLRESRFGKAELGRLTRRWRAEVDAAQAVVDELMERVNQMKENRKRASEDLQKWLFDKYLVMNAERQVSSIWRIFQSNGLVPPGGTGECAAPKLLQYAYSHGYRPLSMGEFWYGEDLSGNRVHGRFYPACHNKCGPLLGYMLRGLETEGDGSDGFQRLDIVFEDEYIVVAEKPFGMLCVPGKTGGISLLERLSGQCGCNLLEVHRLDMDTSGLVVFAKDRSTQAGLRRQFEERSVTKRYKARLLGIPEVVESGRISIPLSPDNDDRPRQKADYVSGKAAVTLYSIDGSTDGICTDVTFTPLTGRTHQLRVHAANPGGLGCPIKGDRLYGGASSEQDRLHLHASYLSFTHPVTKEKLELESPTPSWSV